MLVFYKEKKYMIISFIVLIIDGLLTYFLPSSFNKLNMFYPMLTISLIPFLLDNNMKEYYRFCFFMGILYDILYSNLFLYHALFFLFLSKVDSKIMKVIKNNLGLYLLLVVINILLYDTMFFLLIKFTNYQVVTISDLIYKIKNSLLLNIMSSFIYYFLFKKRDIKHII